MSMVSMAPCNWAIFCSSVMASTSLLARSPGARDVSCHADVVSDKAGPPFGGVAVFAQYIEMVWPPPAERPPKPPLPERGLHGCARDLRLDLDRKGTASRVGASTALSSDTNLRDVTSYWLEVSVGKQRRPATRPDCTRRNQELDRLAHGRGSPSPRCGPNADS